MKPVDEVRKWPLNSQEKIGFVLQNSAQPAYSFEKNSFNDTAFGLFSQWTGRGSPFLFGRLRRRTPAPPPFSSMNSEVSSNQAIQAHEKNGFVL